MRILHIMSGADPGHGGPVTALRGLAETQASLGLQPAVLATFRAGSEVSVLTDMRQAGVDVHLVGPTRGGRDLHPDLEKYVDARVADADVVHIHGLWQEIQHRAARAGQRQQVPYVIRPCGMLSPWSLSQSRLRKQAYLHLRLRANLNRAAALHFTTESERELTTGLALRAPCVVEPNGVDLCEFAELPARGRMRRRFGIPADVPVVLFLGRLHPKKGIDLLVEGFAQVQDPDAVLVIAGPDADGIRKALEHDAELLGLRDRTIFTGMLGRTERIEALVDADLFVLPSSDENFGVAVIEALAAGLPAIVSDQVGVHTEITRAGVGAVVPRDVDAIVDAMNRWLGDPDLRDTTGRRARLFALQQFSWQDIAQRWKEHYTSMCAPATGTE